MAGSRTDVVPVERVTDRRWCFGCDMPYDATLSSTISRQEYCPSCAAIGDRVRAMVAADRGRFLAETAPPPAKKDIPLMASVAWTAVLIFAAIGIGSVVWDLLAMVAGGR